MTAQLTSLDRLPRAAALNAWLAREDAVAAGAAAPMDPVLLGLPDRETLLRALVQRFGGTLDAVLDDELDLATAPYAALLAAYRKAAAHRPIDWRALQREAGDPTVAELTSRQEARIARRARVTPTLVADARATVVDTAAVGAAPRSRRRRVAPRVLARRAG